MVSDLSRSLVRGAVAAVLRYRASHLDPVELRDLSAWEVVPYRSGLLVSLRSSRLGEPSYLVVGDRVVPVFGPRGAAAAFALLSGAPAG